MKRTSIIIFISFNIFSGFAQIATDEAPISFTHPAIGLVLERQPVEIKTLPHSHCALGLRFSSSS
ncbi:hypothetical protein, partial [Parapedobacter soli]|uniref:hypothetical protein n=1 Tax=Parapedobacter soli TaxID=416955 RepID=UPI0021C6B0F8